MATVTKIFENVGTAKVATSAQDARSLKFLRNNYRITMNRYRLLSDAKRFCLELVNGRFVADFGELFLPF